MMRTSGLEPHLKTRMGPIPAGVPAAHCGHHVEERSLKALPGITIRDG